MSLNPRTSKLRRYPALSYLAAAGILALLLPSALNIPRQGPETLAEYAPVPGDSDNTGDLAELSSANSSGLGFGKRGPGPASVDEPSNIPGGKIVRKGGTKRCVGEPARQTEDPLSPACIAFFDGDNGGATSKGVTRDEVRVVVWLDPTGPTGQPETYECSDPPSESDDAMVLGCKAYHRYFNARYQTYKRTVRLIAYRLASNANGTDHKVNAEYTDNRYSPFAAVVGLGGSPFAAAAESAKRGIVSTLYGGISRSVSAEQAPRLTTFMPDRESHLGIAASYLCDRIVGGTPRFSGVGISKTAPRVLGFMGPTAQHRDLSAAMDAECGAPIEYRGDDTKADSTEVARLQAAGVTTVVTIPTTSGNACLAANKASQLGWFPEWVVPGWTGNTSGPETASSVRSCDPSQWRNAFGFTFDYRRDAPASQQWQVAYREGCPDCIGQMSARLPWLYDNLTMLFYGIQAAGPKLTPEAMERGMRSIEQNRSSSPYRPAAYFEPGNWSYVKDAAEVWWSPEGRADGDPQPGCYMIIAGGRRSRAGEFAKGDAGIQDPNGAVCQGRQT